MSCVVCPRLGFAWLFAGCLACLPACGSDGSSSNPASGAGTGGNAPPPAAAGTSAGGTPGAGAPAQTGTAGARPGAAAAGTGATAGQAEAAGARAAAGTQAAGGGAGGSVAAGAGAAAPATELTTIAKELNGLFIDVPCDPSTPTPLAMMATCLHPPNTQHIEKKLMFGGEASKTYSVVLHVRGIWEPTKIQSGQRAGSKLPFTVGGMVPAGSAANDAINYQQYSIDVSAPKQKYWLNDHQYVAHDIHKDDYQATIEVSGGAMIVVTMNDGNDHEIANWTKDFYEGLPPYDTKPSLGQMLRLDVVSVTEKL